MSTQGTSTASGPAEIRVSTVGKTLRINAFKILDTPLEFDDFEEETIYFKIKDVKDKTSALKIYGGQEIKKLARNLA